MSRQTQFKISFSSTQNLHSCRHHAYVRRTVHAATRVHVAEEEITTPKGDHFEVGESKVLRLKRNVRLNSTHTLLFKQTKAHLSSSYLKRVQITVAVVSCTAVVAVDKVMLVVVGYKLPICEVGFVEKAVVVEAIGTFPVVVAVAGMHEEVVAGREAVVVVLLGAESVSVAPVAVEVVANASESQSSA